MTTTNRPEITAEQLDLCQRVIDEKTGEVFYKVTSERDSTVEYTVRWTRGRGFTCTCPSGAQGFANCLANPTCKHCRWSCEHSRLYKEEQQAIAEREARVIRLVSLGLTAQEATEALSHSLIVDGKQASDETLACVYGARTRYTNAEIDAMAEAYQARPFNLLK